MHSEIHLGAKRPDLSDDIWSEGELTSVKNRQLDLDFLTGPLKTKFLRIKHSDEIGSPN